MLHSLSLHTDRDPSILTKVLPMTSLVEFSISKNMVSTTCLTVGSEKNYPCVKTKTAFLRNSFLTKKLSSFTDSHSFVHSFNGEDYKNHLHGVFKKIDKFKN